MKELGVEIIKCKVIAGALIDNCIKEAAELSMRMKGPVCFVHNNRYFSVDVVSADIEDEYVLEKA